MADETENGAGDAHDATVETVDDQVIAEAEAAVANHAAAVDAANQNVASALAKVERQREHLAGAEQGLADAQAALAAIQGA